MQEYKDFSAREAGLALGLVVVLGGTCGIATGAYLSGHLARMRTWGRAVIIPVGFLLGAPAIFYSLHSIGKLRFLLTGSGHIFLELVSWPAYSYNS